MVTSVDKPHDGPGAGGDRLVLDVTSTCGWAGPPVGIIRVEQELIRYAVARRPDVVFAFHHPSLGDRTLNPAWFGTVTGSRGVIDPLHFLRARLRGVRRWRPSRYPAVTALERLRLRAESGAVRRTADLMQQAPVPSDSVSFNFAKIEVEYKPQKADGSLGSPVDFRYDLKTNKTF